MMLRKKQIKNEVILLRKNNLLLIHVLYFDRIPQF